MNNKHQSTGEILSAIRDMMSDEENKNEKPLPKEVLELTQSVDEKKDPIDHTDILELKNLVLDDDADVHLDSEGNKDISLEVEENEIRSLVRESIKNHSSDKIDLIIKQEMKKIIEEKLNKAQVVIESGNNN